MKTIPTLLALSAFSLPSISLGTDPSTIPVKDPGNESSYAERWRILTDLDGDGDDDLLLSEASINFGTMGGGWEVYLQEAENAFSRIGRIDAHPKAISIEPDYDRIQRDPEKRVHARIWVYLRGGGGWGAFGYFRVGAKTVTDLQRITLYPGDSGTDLGRGIYEAAFAKSPIPFRLQFSETSPEGRVSWKDSE